MPGPFEKPSTPDGDTIVRTLERGSRAQQILALGVADDLDARRLAVYKVAETELRAGTLTPDRAFTHIACGNALRAYKEELTDDIAKAQRAADRLHADDQAPDQDGNE